MEYKILNNINVKEKFIKLILICSAFIVVVTIMGSLYMSKKLSAELYKESRKKQLVLAGDHLLTTYLTDNLSGNLELKAKTFLKRFHKKLFVLVPNKEFMNDQIQEALTYGDNSIFIVKEQMEKNSYFKTNITNGYMIKPIITLSDIYIDFSKKPYKFVLETQLRTTKKTTYEFKNLQTTGYLKEVDVKSQGIEHEFWISDFIVTDFTTIKEIDFIEYESSMESN